MGTAAAAAVGDELQLRLRQRLQPPSIEDETGADDRVVVRANGERKETYEEVGGGETNVRAGGDAMVEAEEADPMMIRGRWVLTRPN